jgi:hypothetical protein
MRPIAVRPRPVNPSPPAAAGCFLSYPGSAVGRRAARTAKGRLEPLGALAVGPGQDVGVRDVHDGGDLRRRVPEVAPRGGEVRAAGDQCGSARVTQVVDARRAAEAGLLQEALERTRGPAPLPGRAAARASRFPDCARAGSAGTPAGAAGTGLEAAGSSAGRRCRPRCAALPPVGAPSSGAGTPECAPAPPLLATPPRAAAAKATCDDPGRAPPTAAPNQSRAHPLPVCPV